MRAMVAVSIVVAMVIPAMGRDDGQWGEQPPKVREWFQHLMQPDRPIISCCGEADAYEADDFEQQGDQYVAIITGTRNVVQSTGCIAHVIGDRIVVPNNKIKWDRGNPTGHGIIFLGCSGEVFCYVTPAAL